MKVTIQLTDEELATAIRDYCFEHRSMEIPKELTCFEQEVKIFSPGSLLPPTFSSIIYKFSAPNPSR